MSDQFAPELYFRFRLVQPVKNYKKHGDKPFKREFEQLLKSDKTLVRSSFYVAFGGAKHLKQHMYCNM